MSSPALALPPSWRREMPRRLLEHVPQRKQGFLVERTADQLQPERQAVAVESGWNRDPGQTGHVRGHGEHVVQIHLDRIAGSFLANAEGRRRRRRGQYCVNPGLEIALEVPLDQGAN